MRIVTVIFIVLLLSGCVFVRIPLVPGVQPLQERVVEGTGRAKIAVVEISGMLTMGRGMGRFSREPPLIPRLREELQTAMADRDVVGLVVRIDSPGGSVTASDILYYELQRFRQKKCAPVVVSIGDRGLSGGYYAALAAHEIQAHPTSVLGGVGVIAFRLEVQELLERWGIRVEPVQSGEMKDFWSPLRPSRPEEMAIMQEIIDRMRERFLGLVGESRRLTPEALAAVGSGRIFDAGQALEMGLIDRIGYLDDAVARVREMAGVTEARVILYHRPGTYAGSLYAGGWPLPLEAAAAEVLAEELLFPGLRY